MNKYLFFVALMLGSLLRTFAQDTAEARRSILRWEADGKLHRGDLSPIDETFQRRDVRDLWYFFDMAASHQYGYGRTQSEEAELLNTFSNAEREAMNAKIRAYAGSFLAQIPGHAIFLGDQIDAASEAPPGLNPKNENIRVHNMLALSWLGSPEAIQQIGRFLQDNRNPLGNLRPSSDSTPPMPNLFHAAYALDDALGKRSPLEGKRSPSGILENAHLKELQQWWSSEASLSFRQSLPGVPVGTALAPSAELERSLQIHEDTSTRWFVIVGFMAIILGILIPVLQSRSRNRQSSGSKR